MNPIMIVSIALAMFFVQVSIFKSVIPRQIRYFLCYYPLLGFLCNLGASSLILMFTGVASVVGIGNLGASVLFAAYLKIERWRLDLRSVRKGIFPRIVPAAELEDAHGNGSE